MSPIEEGQLLKNAARIAIALEHIAQALGNPVPDRSAPIVLPDAHPTRAHSSPPVGT